MEGERGEGAPAAAGWVCAPRPSNCTGGLRSYTHQSADRFNEWINQNLEIVVPSVERQTHTPTEKKGADSRLACGPIGCISLNFRANQLGGSSTLRTKAGCLPARVAACRVRDCGPYSRPANHSASIPPRIASGCRPRSPSPHPGVKHSEMGGWVVAPGCGPMRAFFTGPSQPSLSQILQRCM